MIVKDVSMTLLKVVKKEGVAKTTQKPYLFYVATLVDEDANVFTFNLSDDLVETESFAIVLETKNKPVEAKVEFKPKGFDVGGTLLDFEFLK